MGLSIAAIHSAQWRRVGWWVRSWQINSDRFREWPEGVVDVLDASDVAFKAPLSPMPSGHTEFFASPAFEVRSNFVCRVAWVFVGRKLWHHSPLFLLASSGWTRRFGAPMIQPNSVGANGQLKPQTSLVFQMIAARKPSGE